MPIAYIGKKYGKTGMKTKKNLSIWIISLLLLALGSTVWIWAPPLNTGGKIASEIDYNLHIRPIFSDKCFKCHGPDENKREAHLRLDTQEGTFSELKEQPGQFAIVPGAPKQSAVWARINDADPSLVMPPPTENLSLSSREKELIQKWIQQGAIYQKHWAFIPPESSTKEATPKMKWGNNEIDPFILKQMEQARLKPARQAEKAHLLKRLSFDLTGLPPSPELQRRFLADQSPEAYQKVVDLLLASPHYGEKMAIAWLDVARYADSHGYQDDGYRSMWPWRDWVIHAFNENYPYDQFVTYQLAGDLLPDPNKEMLLATGFNRNHKITQEGGVIDEEYRIEYVTDRTNTFGKAFLGMTFECAKCHDHKYDPISQEDYFRTFAFFNQVPEKGIYGTIDASFADPPNMEITLEDVDAILDFVNKKDTLPLQVMIMQDSANMRSTHVLNRGSYDAPGVEVSPGTPKAIRPFSSEEFPADRLGLSQWLFQPDNPLTARVFVNRIWQGFFGAGLVPTTGDFGMQGDFPTHPELLDWLAIHFRESGWDIKALVKTIVLSATYQQSAEISDEKLQRDPENLYLSRYPRSRLSAELVRDHVLASSDLLNREIGGPSVKTYQPNGIWEVATSGRGSLAEYRQDHGGDLYRRGMYVFIKRTVPPPAMLMFDASNRDQCEVERLRTNTPLQALVMLNDPHVLEASRVLAEKLMQDNQTVEEKIETAFQRIICRDIKPEEKQLLSEYYLEEQAYFQTNPANAHELLDVGEYKRATQLDETETAALMQVIHTIYNMEEAIMKT